MSCSKRKTPLNRLELSENMQSCVDESEKLGDKSLDPHQSTIEVIKQSECPVHEQGDTAVFKQGDTRDVKGGWNLGRKSGAGRGKTLMNGEQSQQCDPGIAFLEHCESPHNQQLLTVHPLLENNGVCEILGNTQRKGKGVIQKEGIEGILPTQAAQFECDFQL
ncbi:unnamed protein product [Mytilus coruscus]|uniref:Uncharacterized protein n=1 Tax=Mytilus coruscus TaxID=42192 RepID=A0A6J8C074_MYTCO|nr:unnamed protein product [Mytilus coruscus]